MEISNNSISETELKMNLEQLEIFKNEKIRLAIDQFLKELGTNFEFLSNRLSINESDLIQRAKSNIFPECLTFAETSKASSIINCGIANPTGPRLYFYYSSFFKKEIEIYTAEIDEENQILYRASSLAEKLKCARSLIAMYLKRKIQYSKGIFQATKFKFKQLKTTGLKAGGYFLTLEACEEFEKFYKNKIRKRKIEKIKQIDLQSKRVKLSNENYPGNLEQKSAEFQSEPLSSIVPDFFDQNYSAEALENSSPFVSITNPNSPPSLMSNSTTESNSFSCDKFNFSDSDLNSLNENEMIQTKQFESKKLNIQTEFDSFMGENIYFSNQQESRRELSSMDWKQFFYQN